MHTPPTHTYSRTAFVSGVYFVDVFSDCDSAEGNSVCELFNHNHLAVEEKLRWRVSVQRLWTLLQTTPGTTLLLEATVATTPLPQTTTGTTPSLKATPGTTLLLQTTHILLPKLHWVLHLHYFGFVFLYSTLGTAALLGSTVRTISLQPTEQSIPINYTRYYTLTTVYYRSYTS